MIALKTFIPISCNNSQNRVQIREIMIPLAATQKCSDGLFSCPLTCPRTIPGRPQFIEDHRIPMIICGTGGKGKVNPNRFNRKSPVTLPEQHLRRRHSLWETWRHLRKFWYNGARNGAGCTSFPKITRI